MVQTSRKREKRKENGYWRQIEGLCGARAMGSWRKCRDEFDATPK